jgi:large subunit ribosomal protein L20
MSRVKRGILRTKKRRRILAKTKGYMWGRKSKVRLAKVAILKAGAYAYRDRRAKKRAFRRLWTVNLNAALRERGLKYSSFMAALRKSGILIDRKILANLAEEYPKIFEKVIHASI